MRLMIIEITNIITDNNKAKSKRYANHIKSMMQSSNKAKYIMMMKKKIFQAIQTKIITISNLRFGDCLKMKISMDSLQKHHLNSKNYDIHIIMIICDY